MNYSNKSDQMQATHAKSIFTTTLKYKCVAKREEKKICVARY